MDANGLAQLAAIQLRIMQMQAAAARIEAKLDAVLKNTLTAADVRHLTTQLADSEQVLDAAIQADPSPHGE